MVLCFAHCTLTLQWQQTHNPTPLVQVSALGSAQALLSLSLALPFDPLDTVSYSSNSILKQRANLSSLCAGAPPSAAQAAGKRGIGAQQGVEGPAAVPAAAAQPAASAQRSSISIVPLDSAVVQKLRERDENMAFKCTGERLFPHPDTLSMVLRPAWCSVLHQMLNCRAGLDVLACRWHV